MAIWFGSVHILSTVGPPFYPFDPFYPFYPFYLACPS